MTSKLSKTKAYERPWHRRREEGNAASDWTYWERRKLGCLNSSVHNGSSLPRPIKRAKRRQLKKKSVNELSERKKLLLNAKKYKKRRRSAKYNVNCIKKPSRSAR
jgi:hypothetical protein